MQKKEGQCGQNGQNQEKMEQEKATGGFQLELLAGSKLTYDRPAAEKGKRKRKRKKGAMGGNGGGGQNREEGKERKTDGGKEHEEEIQRMRKINRIFTWGTEIPDPIADFDSLPLPENFRENLRQFHEPTPVQMQAIPIALARRDHLATAPTGSGKTLAFAIPLILHALQQRQTTNPGRLSAVVLEPTKVLAKQTFDNFLKFCSGLDLHCAYLRKSGIEEKCDILVATPNRLIFALEKMKNEQKAEELLEGLEWLIVDECDRIFDRTEGEASFRIQLSKIMRLCRGKQTRRGFYSATFSYEVEDWCKEHLREVAMVCIGARNSANEMVQQELLFAGWEQAKISTIRDIVRRGFDPPALIFLQSKDRAKQLFAELRECFKDIPTGLISGELKESECELVLERFLAGKIWLLICTEILGRGLDFQNVNLVIIFDLPTSIVSYIHRIGRTGRAGRIGRAITLFTESDLPIIRPIATVIHQAGFPVPDYLLRLHNPNKSARKKLKRVAPHRKNLMPGWGKMKHKIKLDGEKKTKKWKRKEKKGTEKDNKIMEKKQKEKKKEKQNMMAKVGKDDDGSWQVVGPRRPKKKRRIQTDDNKGEKQKSK